MENLQDHFFGEPISVIVCVLALIVLAVCLYKIIQQFSMFKVPELISKNVIIVAVVSLLIFLPTLIHNFSPYEASAGPADSVAIVIGNTANSPKAKISNDISKYISDVMQQHRGEELDILAESIVLVEATSEPDVVSLKTNELKEISKNSANADAAIKHNLKNIESQIEKITPKINGANYFEAILEAADNLDEGSNIVVIGSGLSDSGDLDFAHSRLLTDQATRDSIIQDIKEDYGRDYLKGYTVIFYGLGDTTLPQESLTNKQKEIVREDIYKKVVRELGGKVEIKKSTLSGESISTNYVVSTTDTGCGDIMLAFDDDQIKFNPDQTTFVDDKNVASVLSQVKKIYDESSNTIKTIQIDGYIAHYATSVTNLAQDRANAVKDKLVNLGVAGDKINTIGKGWGPFEYNAQESQSDTDKKNRMIKITIERDIEECR